MKYVSHYSSPVGPMVIASEANALSGLWFTGQKYYPADVTNNEVLHENNVILEVKRWLDIYFAGEEPDFMPPVLLRGSDFQMDVWNLLRQIPFGVTVTYGELAQRIARQRALKRMSAQAVGGAVGHNPIGIIVPCHRVVGTNGSLTGYAGGIDKKRFLLENEGVDMSGLFMPQCRPERQK